MILLILCSKIDVQPQDLLELLLLLQRKDNDHNLHDHLPQAVSTLLIVRQTIVLVQEEWQQPRVVSSVDHLFGRQLCDHRLLPCPRRLIVVEEEEDAEEEVVVEVVAAGDVVTAGVVVVAGMVVEESSMVSWRMKRRTTRRILMTPGDGIKIGMVMV